MLEGKPFDYASGRSGIIEDPPVRDNQHSAMYAFTPSPMANGNASAPVSGPTREPGAPSRFSSGIREAHAPR
jgi:hypothetical protein